MQLLPEEIPPSAEINPEAGDYALYFCGLGCYREWLTDHEWIRPRPDDERTSSALAPIVDLLRRRHVMEILRILSRMASSDDYDAAPNGKDKPRRGIKSIPTSRRRRARMSSGPEAEASEGESI